MKVSILSLLLAATLSWSTQLAFSAEADEPNSVDSSELPEFTPTAWDSELAQSDECRIAIETFPIDTSVCADALATAQDPTLRANLASYLAIGLARTNQPTDARAAMDQALNTDGSDWLVHANHGVMSLYLNDFQGSLAATQRALELAPSAMPDLYLNLALAARGTGNFEASRQAHGTYLTLMGYQEQNPAEMVSEPYGPPERRLERGFSGDPFKASRRVQAR